MRYPDFIFFMHWLLANVLSKPKVKPNGKSSLSENKNRSPAFHLSQMTLDGANAGVSQAVWVTASSLSSWLGCPGDPQIHHWVGSELTLERSGRMELILVQVVRRMRTMCAAVMTKS